MATADDRSRRSDERLGRALGDLSSALARTGFGALNSVVGPLVRRGIASPLPVGVGAVVVVTTGRRSGEPREVPLMSARVGDVLVVSTVRRSSHWILNIEASPEVTVWIDGEQREGIAEVRRLPGADMALIRLGRRVGPEPDGSDAQSAAARRRSSAA